MNKYHNTKTYFAGESFDSRAECDRFRELCLLQKAGKIHNLKRQVSFKLADKQENEARGIFYKADFVYETGEVKVVEDVKGFATHDYVIKRKLFKERYGNEYRFSEIKCGKQTEFGTVKINVTNLSDITGDFGD